MNRQYGQNQTLNWVIGSPGHLGRISRPGHWVIILTRCETRVFPVLEKNAQNAKHTLKCWNDKSHCQVSVVGLKSLDISPRAMNFYLYLWLLKILWPENPSSHMSRHLGFQRHRVNWVSGFPGHWVTKCDPVPCLDTTGHTTSLVITVGDQENLAEYLVLCEYRIQRSFQALF